MDEYTLVFVDDILCVSKTFQEHLVHLKNIFEKFRNANMTINIAKSEFGKEEVKFLGHVISTKEISTDPEKIEAIQKFPAPRNIKQLKSFLGLANYYSKFFNRYSDSTAPLLTLLTKGVKSGNGPNTTKQRSRK